MVVRSITIIAAVLLSAGSARAETPFYIGAGPGVLAPSSVNLSISGAVHEDTGLNTSHSGPGKVTFGRQRMASAFAGYYVLPWLRAEADVDYAVGEAKTFSFDLHAGDGDDESNAFPLPGTLSTFILTGNVMVSPWSYGGFTPYIGGGVGAARVQWQSGVFPWALTDADSVNFLVMKTRTVIAADAILGLDYAVTNHLSVGARYRFLWLGTGGSISGPGTEAGAGPSAGAVLTVKSGNMTAHALSAVLSWRF